MSGSPQFAPRTWYHILFLLTRWWRPSEVRWRRRKRRKRRSGMGEQGAWYALYGYRTSLNVNTDFMDNGLHEVAWKRAMVGLYDRELAEANSYWA